MTTRFPAFAITLLMIWGWGLAGLTIPWAIPGAGPTFPGAIAGEHEPDEWEGLPAGEGREEVFATCGACHSLMLVVQQGLSRERWDETLDYMVEEQEMAAREPAERKLILDYLARFYGQDRRARRLMAPGN